MPARAQKKLGDYIDVWLKDVGDGIAAKVYRTDESDTEWAAKKAQAASRAKGSPAEWKSMPEKSDPAKDEIVLQGGKVRIPRGPLSDKEWADRVRQASERKDWDSYTVNGFKVTPTGKTLEDQTPEEIRANAHTLAEGNVAGDPEFDPSNKQAVRTVRADDVRPAQVVPSDGNPDVRPARVEPADKPRGPGMNPAAIAMEMVKGATPEGSNPKLIAAAAKQANMKFYGENNVPDPGEVVKQPMSGLDFVASLPGEAVNDLSALNTSAGDVLNRANESVQNFGGAVNRGVMKTIMPSQYEPAVTNADPLDAPPPAPPPEAPVGPPPGNLVMAHPGGAGSAGGGASVSGEMKMPGFGYKPMTVDDRPMKDAAASFDETARGVLREQNALADENRAMAASIVQKNSEAMAASDELTKQQIIRQQTAKLEQDRMMAAYQSKMDEQERVSAQGIDPGRYWNSKSAGQKAAAVVAGALFGFTGQGMQWLQRLDGLVAEDNRLQESDLNRKIAGLDRSAKGLLTQVDYLDKNASRDVTMLEMAKAQKYKEAEMYLRNFALTTQSMEMKQNALGMAQVLAGKQFEIQQSLSQIAQRNAAEINQARAHNAAQAAEMYRFKLAQDAKKNADGKIMLGAQAQEAGRLAGSVEIAKQLQQQFGVKGLPARVMDKVAALFPGTEATNYNTKAKLAIQMIGPLAGSGVLSDQEYNRWENMIAQAGDINGEAKLDSLVSELQTKYVQHLTALKQAGYDTSAFEQSLMSSGGGGVPSYAAPH